jgi:hypothetical protein
MTSVLACPACKQQLQIPPAMLGKSVQCPKCRQVFNADPAAAAPATAVAAKDGAEPTRQPPPAPPAPDEEFAEPIPEVSYGEVKRKSRKKSRSESGYFDELMKSQSRRRLNPHRGVLILILGVLGLTTGSIFGIVAWILANNDLHEMHSGRMDPEGEQMTNIGRILGIVSVCLTGLAVLACCSCGILNAFFAPPRIH